MGKQTTIEERFGKCPYATAQTLISGKWAVLILLYLEEGPIRFNELLRKMPKMTHATLSVQLKALEEYGLMVMCAVIFIIFVTSFNLDRDLKRLRAEKGIEA